MVSVGSPQFVVYFSGRLIFTEEVCSYTLEFRSILLWCTATKLLRVLNLEPEKDRVISICYGMIRDFTPWRTPITQYSSIVGDLSQIWKGVVVWKDHVVFYVVPITYINLRSHYSQFYPLKTHLTPTTRKFFDVLTFSADAGTLIFTLTL